MISLVSRLRSILPELVLAVILLLTLDRIEAPPPNVELWEWCLMCGSNWGTDVALNIVLFIPLGFALRVAGVSWIRSTAAIVTATASIELAQLIIPGRITSVDDLLANTVGGVFGFWLGRYRWHIIAPRRAAATALSVAAGVGVMVVLWGTLWLFGPAPTGHPYWGQFAPVLGQFDSFDGTVLEADVGGAPLRNGRLPNTDAVRAHLQRDSVTVHAVASGRRRTRMLAPVVSIFDGEHNEVMLLGRIRYDLVFRLRRRSTVFGFRTPTVTVWRAFPAARPGTVEEPVQLSGTIDGYAISATAKFDTTCSTRTIHFRHTHGWAYLLPFENLYTPRAAGFTTLWLALLFAPLGYYAAAAAYRIGRLTGIMAVVGWMGAVAVLGLSALPRWAGLGAGTVAEWSGVALGLLAGLVAGSGAMSLSGRGNASHSGTIDDGPRA